MIHIVTLAKRDGETFAYHYMTTDKQRFLEMSRKIQNSPEELLASFSVHVISDPSKTFSELQEMDPYFADAILLESFEEFLTKLSEKQRLTTLDIAAYLFQKYDVTGAFVLQKTLYHIYASYLEKYKKVPFKANFVAFEHGPVDVEVYRANKYHPETLRLSVEFEKKVFACPYRKELLELVDEIVGRCALQYQGAFASPKKNLTHHKGTPWDRAYARQQNAPILDEDIIKYHYLEHLGES
ncbi:Panacea domain-containing protein [Ligilactobacillus faecis]|uniref:Panacea domain-containing protein n=1 Tax=Ligilactobacillus faecis TaxID=762833 RepID=UPI0024697A5B|nr:hypothetical protein [Ligilactobacillus faecis]WGN89881.1 hypothetical protein QFX10_02060 [Ligilactobacillus faecis]